MEVRDRISQLERTILELGTEIFRMKTQVSSLKGEQETFIEMMSGLRNILDEKGLITEDDFDNAVALGEAIATTSQSSPEYHFEEELERIKKNSH